MNRALLVALLPAGVLLTIVGSALAWGSQPMVGFLVGSAGLILIVVGAILVRTHMIRPFLEKEGP